MNVVIFWGLKESKEEFLCRFYLLRSVLTQSSRAPRRDVRVPPSDDDNVEAPTSNLLVLG